MTVTHICEYNVKTARTNISSMIRYLSYFSPLLFTSYIRIKRKNDEKCTTKSKINIPSITLNKIAIICP